MNSGATPVVAHGWLNQVRARTFLAVRTYLPTHLPTYPCSAATSTTCELCKPSQPRPSVRPPLESRPDPSSPFRNAPETSTTAPPTHLTIMLAEPRWSCTIPSLHDDTPLDVRIYHPWILHKRDGGGGGGGGEMWWTRRRGVVVAHPYAALGGSYDDGVVGVVVEEFLAAGWVVGTFNFRGAHAAKGRTSWSGKPELVDYHSFAAFFIHYISYLRPNPPPDPSPVPQTVATDEPAPVVVLAGYSYGSLIARNLPPLPSLLQPLAAPTPGSAAHEILLTARKLAAQDNREFGDSARDAERRGLTGREHTLSVKMGGEETSPEMRRRSRDTRSSFDAGAGRSDVRSRLRSLSHGHHHHHHRRAKDVANPQPPPTAVETDPGIQLPEIGYLLISPLTPPTATLLAPALARPFWSRSGDADADADAQLKTHATLAVYGAQDAFAGTTKMREWVVRMQRESCARGGFVGVEVGGAGHFWRERGVERALRGALRAWEGRVGGVGGRGGRV
ncbi:hypothetical protein PMIN04_012757 [Paraphaeosphaeria minitans]